MKKVTLGLVFLVSLLGFSQSPLEKIKAYANENRVKFSLTDQDISDLVIVNEFSSETTGINNYHVKQRHNGIEVFNSDSNFWIKNGEVINGCEEFIPNVSKKVNASGPSINVSAALLNIQSQIENTLTSVQILEVSGHEYKLSNGAHAEYPIRAELVYFMTEEKALKLAWDYEFFSQDLNHLWSLKVDALTGKLLEKLDMVLTCNFGGNHTGHSHSSNLFAQNFFKSNASSAMLTPGTTNYRVIPWNYESPNHSPRQLMTNPETANASPNGWHNIHATIGGGTVTTQFTNTRGNNVYAKDDVDGDNSGGAYATFTSGTYPSLTFDHPYPGTGVVASTYLPAATTNLFYMNNIMHDLWYQYGFTEANGNFQMSNYGRGGTGGDAVSAEAQDGSQANPPNLNNANFATPSDGSAPRMQMYLWDVGPSFTVTISAPASVAGTYAVKDNNFHPGHVTIAPSPGGVSGTFVLYNDGTPDSSDACTAAINGAALSGKIAIIRRGDCTFVEKVKFAQQAGAIAVLMVNNVDGTIIMGGADATITIPAVSISQAEGEALIAALSSGSMTGIISAPASAFVNSDGDFDNGIVAHEYGHGISTRLTGNCISSSEQQGEGWSDWFWLAMQIKPGDTRNGDRGFATFALNQPPNGNGLREYKYSTNMSVNPHTFGDTNSMWYTDGQGVNRIDVHSVGSVWAAMLWDLTWNYIDRYGYDPNIYTGNGGNNKVMRLVMDAIKLDGCAPSFVTARDAILAADQATTGGQNYCMIWQTFARRGLGLNASSGTNTGVAGIQDQVEDFTVPASCAMGVDDFNNQKSIRVYPNPTRGQLNIAISNYSGKLSIQVFDLNGRKVYNQEVNDFNAESAINLGNLQSGMYLIKVDGENLNYTQKIILN
ncbi:M36 fungalysin family metalloprotease [Flavobacterium limnosediminis JC2902]|uniref:M36 fungalysin family metalloprotease n=1 Tax=Flavobacterium limnosediminis JC2902 TaxID=1341181 RepID=V6SQK0_9FLAO|nr:T9SS-dependent M36 family metallopeptidase [Flavobacterium limnosediminis]ESU28973.1 M36 fungalysin family metalloprotease [Flavobacterium limnosediminis JC2902]